MARLAGKVAVITGGSSGIRLATAQRFVDEGARVFIMGRRRGELDKAKALIGDVTNSADLDKLFATVLAKEGGLDVLVANSARVESEMLGKSRRRTSMPPSTSTPTQRCSRFKSRCR
jgi:NAD(P)-dependent dehydrogenase (short-subunit alcohol dehydrogenase family)